MPVGIRLLRSILLLSLLFAWFGLITVQPSCTHYPPTKASVSLEQLRTHVKKLAIDYTPRNFQRLQNLNASARYISGEFKRAGGRVSEQFFKVEGETYRNVIVSFGPESGSRIVVGAHYDACGETPGADDNASGVAGLIELAHLLGRAELEHPVELVAYSLEEPPFFATGNMGSAHHAAALRQAGVDVRAMICLEMIGYFRDEKGSQRFPSSILKLFYPDRGNYIAVVGGYSDRKLLRLVKASMRGATDLPVHAMCAPRNYGGIDLSDHRNYWNNGYHALMVTDTSFYRNPGYHGIADTPDNLDYERMARVVEGVFEAVVRLANDGH